jgi:hypothetical protein
MIPFPRRASRAPVEEPQVDRPDFQAVTAIDATSTCTAFERTFAEEYAKARDLPTPPAAVRPTCESPPRPRVSRLFARTIITPRTRWRRRRSALTWTLALGGALVVSAIVIHGATSGHFRRALDLVAAIVHPASSMWH